MLQMMFPQLTTVNCVQNTDVDDIPPLTRRGSDAEYSMFLLSYYFLDAFER